MGSRTCDTTSSGLGLVVVSAAEVNGVITVTNNTTTSTIGIAIPNAAGPYHIVAWLSDSATDGRETVYVPSVSGVTSWDFMTDSSGNAGITVQNNTSSRTWYLWTKFHRMNISGAITAGV